MKPYGRAFAPPPTATPGLKYAKTPDPAETTIAGIFSDQNLTVSHLASRRFPCAQVSRAISCSRRASGIAAVTEDINDGATASAAAYSGIPAAHDRTTDKISHMKDHPVHAAA